jgi:general secretion pathway protein J
MSATRVCRSEAGFTLIELLMAMVIFAVLSAGMYTVFNSYQTTREITDRDARRLADLQRFFGQLEREFQQVLPRTARDDFQLESPMPAVKGTPDTVEFTRTGWTQPPFASHLRSELQRVAYFFEEGALVRAQWPVVDRPDNLAPMTMVALEKVEAVGFRYFMANEEGALGEVETWPAMMNQDAMAPDATGTAARVDAKNSLPIAIQVTLLLSDYGEIHRTFALVKEQW